MLIGRSSTDTTDQRDCYSARCDQCWLGAFDYDRRGGYLYSSTVDTRMIFHRCAGLVTIRMQRYVHWGAELAALSYY